MSASGSAEALVPEQLIQDTAGMFAMLSATVRLQVMWLLSLGARDVGTLAEETGQTMATVSHHLGKLKLGGYVKAQRDGRHQVYVVSNELAVKVVRVAINAGLPEPASALRSTRAG
ncbi:MULTISPECIES: metalloregulator ArsR/SmtB family transcription factor [unclassified Mycobacterium]|uniref:ArsR/SmtB family transcription factor n=1 Tax=unclassified Mycobacterium TaxID=2642494 RepID=UPI0029C687AD|nr:MULTISPECIES: metalloregulator ArsR/SmtB family transcription factor [unclassified Mycobacterium]